MAQHDVDQPTEVFPAQGNGGSPAGDSIAERLRASIEQKTAPAIHEVQLPGWEGMLRARFGPIPSDAFRRISKRITGSILEISDVSSIDANADLVIQSCREIVFHDPETGATTPLAEAIGDNAGPVRFDVRLAEYLGLAATRAREVLFEVIRAGGVPQPEAAVNALGGEVFGWLGGKRDEAMEEALGE